jgi:hypothetical protein
MRKGLIDHWVPTAPAYSKFWRADLAAAKRAILEVREDVGHDGMTFYTKWYTNGMKSDLPFLRNHPDSSNVKTGNEWGRELIDFLHGQGMTASAMMQLYTYEQPEWEEALSIGGWDVRICAGNDADVRIADFTQDAYVGRMQAIIREQVEAFPDLDDLFFEFEGIFPQHLAILYDRWAAANGMPPAAQATIAPETGEFLKRTGQPAHLLWSEEGRTFLRGFYARNMDVVDEVLRETGYKGRHGICFHIYDYETFLYPALAAERPGWALMPWNYWMWTRKPFEECRAVAKDNIARWAKEGHEIHYIGDATVGSIPKYSDVVEDFYGHCLEQGVAGYLGMGHPDLTIGLRWTDVTDEMVLEARKLYTKMYRNAGGGTR